MDFFSVEWVVTSYSHFFYFYTFRCFSDCVKTYVDRYLGCLGINLYVFFFVNKQNRLPHIEGIWMPNPSC